MAAATTTLQPLSSLERLRGVIILFFVLFVIWCVIFARYDSSPYGGGNGRRRGRDDEELRRRMTRARRLVDLTKPTVATNDDERHPPRVDCSVATRYCTNDADCDRLCRRYDGHKVACDPSTHVCGVVVDKSPPSIGGDGDGGGKKEICDARSGEYAMLVGYSSLGVAAWRCVPLYNQFNDTEHLCEGGLFRMDATLRDPSYRDCSCPDDRVLMIKRLIDQYDIGLPHCIDRDDRRFYEEDMIAVEDDDDDEV